MEIAGVHLTGEAHLLDVVQTTDAPRFFLGQRERREEQAREDGDNRNDDKQFDQRKSANPWRAAPEAALMGAPPKERRG